LKIKATIELIPEKTASAYQMIKDHLLPVATNFNLIRETTDTPQREIAQVFNFSTHKVCATLLISSTST